MRTHILPRFVWLFFLMTGWITAQGQDAAEVPGDNFSLEGALEIFKKSASPEEFERMLNDPEAKVNNLDLNGDGYIDYIRVIDRYEGNVHAFIMQAMISKRESQDIAVITLEKLANGKAVLQIIGDEDIYGVETIIEPTREVRTYGGTMTTHVVVDVWAWPFVRYVYGPHYTVWISPWAWDYRPFWWHPWRPIAYYSYYPYWHHYHPYYRVCHSYRVVHAEHLYRSHRTTSVVVSNRYDRQIHHYRSTRIDDNGRYRSRSDRSNASVRYDSNGRIRSTRSTSSRAGSSSSIVNSRPTRSYDTRSSGNSQRSSSGSNMQRSTERSSGSRSEEYRKPSSTSRTERSYTPRSSTNSRSGSSYSNRSSGSNQRSSSGSNVQRSTQRSSGNSSYQRSSSSGRSERSYSGSRSSGSSSRSYSSQSSGRSSGGTRAGGSGRSSSSRSSSHSNSSRGRR